MSDIPNYSEERDPVVEAGKRAVRMMSRQLFTVGIIAAVAALKAEEATNPLAYKAKEKLAEKTTPVILKAEEMVNPLGFKAKVWVARKYWDFMLHH